MEYLINEMGIEKDLVLEFLFYFSRFEYALKRSGQLKRDDGDAEADWDGFFKKYEARIAKICSESKAAQFLIANPPRKQIAKNKILGWGVRDHGHEPIHCRLSIIVRTVRNNLFHGGKFHEGPIQDISRDKQLIASALDVLKQMSREIDSIKGYFDRSDILA